MQFGGVVALNDVTFEIKKQEILGLIGPNGAGKTTIFNVITGVYQVTKGDITFEGKSIRGIKRYKITRGGVARTFQNIRLWGDMTALENVSIDIMVGEMVGREIARPGGAPGQALSNSFGLQPTLIRR